MAQTQNTGCWKSPICSRKSVSGLVLYGCRMTRLLWQWRWLVLGWWTMRFLGTLLETVLQCKVRDGPRINHLMFCAKLRWMNPWNLPEGLFEGILCPEKPKSLIHRKLKGRVQTCLVPQLIPSPQPSCKTPTHTPSHLQTLISPALVYFFVAKSVRSKRLSVYF